MIFGTILLSSYVVNIGYILHNRYKNNKRIINKLNESCTFDQSVKNKITGKIHTYLLNHSSTYKELDTDKKKEFSYSFNTRNKYYWNCIFIQNI